MNSVINLHVLCLYGLPCNIFSNQAHQFVSRRCSLLSNRALYLPPGFHLQSLEQAEKTNGDLEKQLCFLSFLVLAEYELNSLQPQVSLSEHQTCVTAQKFEDWCLALLVASYLTLMVHQVDAGTARVISGLSICGQFIQFILFPFNNKRFVIIKALK